jgi:hypothetical protein
MILYNPCLDFYEPENQRHLWEECVILGRDPFELEPIYQLVSAIEHLHVNSPPSIIMFGTKDAFYPQQIRWIVKCRELRLTCYDYVYKGQVHSWYNNSPHLEYTMRNVDNFLVEIGLLNKQPYIELPHKTISPGRARIQEEKYTKKKDWVEKRYFFCPRYPMYSGMILSVVLPVPISGKSEDGDIFVVPSRSSLI